MSILRILYMQMPESAPFCFLTSPGNLMCWCYLAFSKTMQRYV